MHEELPRAWGGGGSGGTFRGEPANFRVAEQLDVTFSDDGEFHWLKIRKTRLSTPEAVTLLAKWFGLPPKAVSFSGMKDKQAVTEQWFSVHRPGKDFALPTASLPAGFEVLEHYRHRKKLRRGTHRANRFELVLQTRDDATALEPTLEMIAAKGFPNYFGEQRFGRDGDNIRQLRRWFEGQSKPPSRQRKSLLLSAGRSLLFNRVLKQRVLAGAWDQLLPGDVLALRDSASVFLAQGTAEEAQRVSEGELHPTGPLPGRESGLLPGTDALAFEQAVVSEEPRLIAGLVKEGVSAARRSLRCMPADLSWEADGRRLRLHFVLPSGCFATALVRELGNFTAQSTEVLPAT